MKVSTSRPEIVRRITLTIVFVGATVAILGTGVLLWFGPQWRAIEHDRAMAAKVP